MHEKIKRGNSGSETGISDTRARKPPSNKAAASKDREKIKRKTDSTTLRVQEKKEDKKSRRLNTERSNSAKKIQ